MLRILAAWLAIAPLFSLRGEGMEKKRSLTLGGVFDELGIAASGDVRGGVLTRSLKRQGRRHLFWTLAAREGARRFRIEITAGLDPAAAGRLIDQRSVEVRSLFKPYSMDYFGALRGRAVVPKSLRPEVLYPERGLLRSGPPLFILWSDKDGDYHVVSKSAAVQRGVLGFRYCGSRGILIQFETFEPAAGFGEEKAVSEFGGLRCS